MSKLNIPESWTEANLDQIAEINMGQSPPSSEVSKNTVGYGLIGGAANLKESGIVFDQYVKKPNKVCRSQDIILCIRATIGRLAIADREYCIGRGVAAISPKNGIQLEYLKNVVAYNSEYLDKNATGSTFRQVDKLTIQKMPTPLPPLGEQRRIVAKIESTQEKVKAIESSISKAEELIEKYRESLLQKAFRGELVPQDPNDEPASKLIERIRAERAKQSDGKKKNKDDFPPIKPEEIPFEIPKSWEWVRLGDVCSRITYGLTIRPKYQSQGVPVISAKEIRDGIVNYEVANRIAESEFDILRDKCKIFSGDVLFSKTGTIGKVAVVTENIKQASSQNIAVITTFLEPNYLGVLLESPYIQKIARKGIKSSAIPDLQLGVISNFLIPLPPENEQLRIYQHLNRLANVINRLKLKTSTLQTKSIKISSAILEAAFAGRLVAQIPSEGTGHDLLEKIKSEPQLANEKINAKKTSLPTKKKRSKK